MTMALIQILTGALGSLGFGIVLRMQPKHLLWAMLGGGLAWTAYLLADAAGMDLFFANMVAALVANLYAMILAVVRKTPAVIFRTTAIIPLIPGGSLYETMSALVAGDEAAAMTFGTKTLLTAAAIGFGTLIFSAILHLVTQIRERRAA